MHMILAREASLKLSLRGRYAAAPHMTGIRWSEVSSLDLKWCALMRFSQFEYTERALRWWNRIVC